MRSPVRVDTDESPIEGGVVGAESRTRGRFVAVGEAVVHRELGEGDAGLRPVPVAFRFTEGHASKCPARNSGAQTKKMLDKAADSSQKYEAGTHNLLGIVGLVAAMELILELGLDNIAATLLRHRALLVAALQGKGFTVLHAKASPETGSSIVSFFRPDADMAALHEKLLAAGVVTSLRADRTGQKYIRLSPHFYNTEEEFQRLLELLVI